MNLIFQVLKLVSHLKQPNEEVISQTIDQVIVIFVVVRKRSDADVVDLILYSVPNMLHAQHHVGKRTNTRMLC